MYTHKTGISFTDKRLQINCYLCKSKQYVISIRAGVCSDSSAERYIFLGILLQ